MKNESIGYKLFEYLLDNNHANIDDDYSQLLRLETDIKHINLHKHYESTDGILKFFAILVDEEDSMFYRRLTKFENVWYVNYISQEQFKRSVG